MTVNELHAAGKFKFSGKILRAVPCGNGHINSTYRVECELENESANASYILQKINGYVFRKPMQVIENAIKVTGHLRHSVIAAGGDPYRECLNLIQTKSGGYAYMDDNGECWRALDFIDRAVSYELAERPELMYNAGRAFGRFQRQLEDFTAGSLHETIPGFHDTRARYTVFEQAVAADRMGRAAEAAEEIEFIRKRRNDMSVLSDLQKSGAMPLRVTHNDTKLNNVMMDRDTGHPVCVIDLDTVMPGLLINDFGDSIRFGASTAAEDERDLSRVSCDMSLFRHFAEGFIGECGAVMTDSERRHLVFASRMMTLECGMRFLTDYLDGDRYFRISREGHNLDRCRTQLRLVADMENKREIMDGIVDELLRNGF